MKSKTSSTPDIAARCREVVVAIEERKGDDLRVLHLAQISSLADYFLICSGNSERQVQAIAEGIQERLKADHVRPSHIEGFKPGRWILLDYGDFVVHVFDRETRAYYGLDKLWADASDVTREFAS